MFDLKRFPRMAVLVLSVATAAACGEDDPTDVDEDDGTSTVTFTYTPGPNAPAITAVSVPGSFNTPDVWNPADPDFQMTENNGTWSVTVELEPGTYSYKYHFNGDTWASNMCADDVFGNPAGGQVSPQLNECDAADNNNAVITVVDDND